MGGWRRTTLGELCEEGGGGIQTGPFGSQLHASDYVVHGTPSVMPQNIGDNSISIDGIARVSDADLARLSKYQLRAGDIVYSRRGDVEKRALVREENDGWLCGTGCLRVRLGDSSGNVAAFVSYALGTEDSRAWIVRHSVGATMPNLNTSILSAVPLSIPDASEQQAIAAVLGALDDKIAANTKLARTADELACMLFADSVRDLQPSAITFGDLGLVGGGGTPSTAVSEYWDGDINWATPTDVTALKGPYLRGTARTITADGLEDCASPLYPVGSILMTSRATIGSFAIALVPTAVNQGFIVVNPEDDHLQYWLFHEMRSRLDEFVALANGATFLELSRGNFKKFRVRLADEAMIKAFDARAAVLHETASAALTESDQLATLRDALLPELMSGRLQVKDAETLAGEVL